MLSNTRQDQILNYLKKNVSATVKELAAALYVSEATVRRDLFEKQSLGLLQRSHGGAILLEATDESSIIVRMTEHAKEKGIAVSNALPHIPTDFKTVFLDSSSTILALAMRLSLVNKTVVTNNLQTVLQLSKIRDINLVIPGGNISLGGTSVTGSWTSSQLSNFHFDLMLTSCAAIVGDGAYETSLDQREVKRTVFDRSDCRILLCDHTKFERTGTYLFENLSAFDKVIFDRLTDKQKEELKNCPIVC